MGLSVGLGLAILMVSSVQVETATAGLAPRSAAGAVVAPSPEDPAQAALVREFGIAAGEAERRLRLQERTPALEEALSVEHPTSFGGLWIDQEAGGVVVIAATDDGAALAALARSMGFERPTVVPAARSLRQLELIRTSVRSRTNRLAVGLGIDVRANVVVVRRPPNVRAADVDAAISGEPTGAVRHDASGEDRPGSCIYAQCSPPLRGSVELHRGYNSTSHNCTAGFKSNRTRITRLS